MNPITLRNLPKHVAQAVRRRAKERGLSLNRAVGQLLEEAVDRRAVSPDAAPFHDLDALAGTWSAEDADEFDSALLEQRRVDPKVWR